MAWLPLTLMVWPATGLLEVLITVMVTVVPAPPAVIEVGWAVMVEKVALTAAATTFTVTGLVKLPEVALICCAAVDLQVYLAVATPLASVMYGPGGVKVG